MECLAGTGIAIGAIGCVVCTVKGCQELHSQYRQGRIIHPEIQDETTFTETVPFSLNVGVG